MAIGPDHVAADSLVGVQRQQTNAGRWPVVGWNAFRDTLCAPRGLDRAAAEALALASDKIQRQLNGAAPRKVIVVPDRLVNIVA